MQNEQDNKKEKKKPGRPKKTTNTVRVDECGVRDVPANADDIVEMVYCNPTLFKKLLHLYKQFKVSEIELNFDKDCLKIVTRDHIGKSIVYTTIDGKCMNLYYCKEPLRVCVKLGSLAKVINSLGKNHYKISLLLKADYRSTLYIITKELDYGCEDTYEIDVVYKPENAAVLAQFDNDTDYPIKFKVSFAHFKYRINHINKLSETFNIEKVGTDPLRITYDKAQSVNFSGVYSDIEKIALDSKLAEDDIFTVSVVIDYIKPFSNSSLGDDVIIAAHKTSRMSFTTYIDRKDAGWAACVKVFTDVKDYRRPQ